MANAELIVSAALEPLAPGRVFPDVAPPGTAPTWITYQAVGGVDETAFDGLPDVQNTRMQVTVWAATRGAAVTCMQQVLQALTAAPVRGKPIGAPVSVYEEETKLYGSRSDISIWFTV